MRISIKVFTDGANHRPNYRSDDSIQEDFRYYNRLCSRAARGLQFQITEIVSLPSTLSAWFSVPARSAVNRDWLLANAVSNAPLYAYRASALNIYINDSASGVCCGAGNGLIFVGHDAQNITMLHELGHRFGLFHTQGAGCNSCCPDPLGCCDVPGDDGMADTILDLPCWDSDTIAIKNFGAPFDALAAGPKRQVEDVWLNIMSYHVYFYSDLLERWTANQWDGLALGINQATNAIGTNRFRFVDGSAGKDSNSGLNPNAALRTLSGSSKTALPGDVILLRAGVYTETNTSGPWRLTSRRLLAARQGVVQLRRAGP